METVNFIYFAYNFSVTHLEKIFTLLGNYKHFKSKFETARGDNGTKRFFSWFMELSRDNQLIVVNWVNENYKGVSF